ncbi:MAG TPA: response regulator transcription factor [Pyrinomonadaceae bacterium]|nr:response regulator transcription factor [Pyrinomonadaceae bacterium]
MDDLRILIADDHAVLRDGLKALVNAQPDMKVIAEAENGRIALQKTRELQPDVVVMDVSMPEMNGAQATQRLKQICPEIKVLALTAYEDKAYLRHLMGAGASGFLLKRAAIDELIQAIRIVAKGAIYIDPTLAGKVLGSFIRQPGGGRGTPTDELSDREAEVLRLIAWGYSNKEIANDLAISVKTVETYKARFAEKLDLHSRTAIVRYAVRQGWMQDS